jgi:hypothetical protein
MPPLAILQLRLPGLCNFQECYQTISDFQVRLASEVAVFILIILQLTSIGLDIYHAGRKRWWTVMVGFE